MNRNILGIIKKNIYLIFKINFKLLLNFKFMINFKFLL